MREYTLNKTQLKFIVEFIKMVETTWYDTKYTKTAFKEKGKDKITVLNNNVVLSRLKNIEITEKYNEKDRPLLKKIRQKYKRYKRFLHGQENNRYKFTLVD